MKIKHLTFFVSVMTLVLPGGGCDSRHESTASNSAALDAADAAGKSATWEFTVMQVKFAKRRNMHFLSSTANFRSSSNKAIAIRDADVQSFRQAGIEDLESQYLGKKIRARGVVFLDEEQVLLQVRSPEQLQLLDEQGAAGASASKSEIVVVNEMGKEISFKYPFDESLPRQTASIVHEGSSESYEGVAVAAILERAEITLGAEARGPQLTRYALITSLDGYVVLFSLPEIDPLFSDQQVLLADRVNSQELTVADGAPRLVVAADKRQRRWINQVARIEIRRAIPQP